MTLKTSRCYGIVGSMLCVRNCPPTLRYEILSALTFTNPAWSQASRFSPYGYVSEKIPRTISLAWVIDSQHIIFPRGFSAKQKLTGKALKQYNRIKWRDVRVSAPTIFPRCLFVPNKEQKSLLTSFKRSKAPFGNRLFVAPTSAGKTVASALAAVHTGQRTLVLCWNDAIMRSWYKDLQDAFRLKPEEIGMIKQKTWRIGEYFTLASIKTLARRKARWVELFSQIGTTILDEADLISAPSIFNFVMECPSKYLIGATATDKNENGYGFYFKNIFGPPTRKLYNKEEDTESSMKLREVKEVTTSFSYAYQQGNLDTHDLNAAIMDDEGRNQLIAHHVKKDWAAGHSPLVITKRVAHCHTLAKIFAEHGVKGVRLITGETNAQRKKTDDTVAGILSRKYRCIIATDAVKLGANLNPLDVLHVAMPFKSKRAIEQFIGRIRRRHPRKDTCRVTYYVDKEVSYLYNLFKWQAIPVFKKLKVPRFLGVYVA